MTLLLIEKMQFQNTELDFRIHILHVLEKAQKRHDQTIDSLELQIKERSIIMKKLQDELLKREFEKER